MNTNTATTPKQWSLRPSDIVVACQLTQTPSPPYTVLAAATLLSVGECHAAIRRLVAARLMNPSQRRVVPELLSRFLVVGVPHAFPALIGPSAVGVATAFSAAAFRASVAPPEAYVWPDGNGHAEGLALTPLFAAAVRLPLRNVALYEVLALIDALRVGDTRERQLAEAFLRERLQRRED